MRKEMRNLARGAWERNGAGPHESKTTYKRTRCPNCNSRLDSNDLCPICDINPWDPNQEPLFNEEKDDSRDRE